MFNRFVGSLLFAYTFSYYCYKRTKAKIDMYHFFFRVKTFPEPDSGSKPYSFMV